MDAEKMTITLDTEDMRTVLASVGFVVCDWKEKARDEKAGKMAHESAVRNVEMWEAIYQNIETLSPLHYESWAVKVCDAGQWDAWRERERQKSALVDVFYNALRTNGGDQNAAKAVQRETAVQWNAVEAFNLIYA